MLNAILTSWNEAIENRTVVSYHKDPATNQVLMETSNIVFRDVDIEMVSKLGNGGKYFAELFVPSTKRFLDNNPQPSRTRAAMEVLIAISPNGAEHVKRCERRRQEQKRRVISDIQRRRYKLLLDIGFPKQAACAVMNSTNRNLTSGSKMYWDNAFFTMLETHADEFTLRGEHTYPNAQTRLQALCAIYDDIVYILSDTELDNFGNPWAPKGRLLRYLTKRESSWTALRADARHTLSQLLDYAETSTRFIYFLSLLKEYYHLETGISPEAKLAEVKSRRQYGQAKLLRTDPTNGKFVIADARPLAVVASLVPENHQDFGGLPQQSLDALDGVKPTKGRRSKAKAEQPADPEVTEAPETTATPPKKKRISRAKSSLENAPSA